MFRVAFDGCFVVLVVSLSICLWQLFHRVEDGIFLFCSRWSFSFPHGPMIVIPFMSKMHLFHNACYVVTPPVLVMPSLHHAGDEVRPLPRDELSTHAHDERFCHVFDIHTETTPLACPNKPRRLLLPSSALLCGVMV